ncbi:hypothetical protein DL239_00625 [Sedimentitalea sp. CY04]|uniref:Uncharacterized protein n=1 Tax=Parasedimentitalea denitrificans TaxID=2211118 RepID=A0ABX0W3E9_9RHOB|nr:hypothetical protein [Sedimentitalea sp. CY04]
MPPFRGLIQDAFHLQNEAGVALSLTQVEGIPEIGMMVSVAGQPATIRDFGHNSTDGQVISSRSCLTGEPCSPYGGIFVEWNKNTPAPEDLCKQWVQEEDGSDV